jgi:hypothetical protein
MCMEDCEAAAVAAVAAAAAAVAGSSKKAHSMDRPRVVCKDEAVLLMQPSLCPFLSCPSAVLRCTTGAAVAADAGASADADTAKAAREVNRPYYVIKDEARLVRFIERMGHGFRGELLLAMQNPKPQLRVLLLKESTQCACCCNTTLLHVPRTVLAVLHVSSWCFKLANWLHALNALRIHLPPAPLPPMLPLCLVMCPVAFADWVAPPLKPAQSTTQAQRRKLQGKRPILTSLSTP